MKAYTTCPSDLWTRSLLANVGCRARFCGENHKRIARAQLRKVLELGAGFTGYDKDGVQTLVWRIEFSDDEWQGILKEVEGVG